MKTTDDIENATEKYWMLSNIGLFEFFYPDSVYDSFYLDKRNLFLEVNEKLLTGRIIPTPVKEHKNKSIVILAQHLRTIDETLTRFVVMYANELSKTDYDVHLVLEEPFFYNFALAIHFVRWHSLYWAFVRYIII